ncbi:MAG: hypothetical protein J3K34DRAFT_415688 [Monoraphidium minutum]|nr:MAG: hypothetical protein J3K34DRAFT_415688 [Monoraphidium minutum]
MQYSRPRTQLQPGPPPGGGRPWIGGACAGTTCSAGGRARRAAAASGVRCVAAGASPPAPRRRPPAASAVAAPAPAWQPCRVAPRGRGRIAQPHPGGCPCLCAACFRHTARGAARASAPAHAFPLSTRRRRGVNRRAMQLPALSAGPWLRVAPTPHPLDPQPIAHATEMRFSRGGPAPARRARAWARQCPRVSRGAPTSGLRTCAPALARATP